MSAYVPAAIRRLVRERFADRCAYCRTAELLTATQFEIEHIDPLAAGGETVFANLCLACPMCNRYKSDALSAFDPVSATTVPLFHPQLQLWSEHFAWSDDWTEIVGLSPVGRATVAALRMNRPAMIRVRQLWVAMAEHPPKRD
ncbi:MAG TPA: HNH endonuclease signature motif containing protein [Phycisphaerae bacterium]|jgi:hypothetical protein|nr:HNH endonuclease signature motif containing protein [Phycisphaerae bacterium]